MKKISVVSGIMAAVMAFSSIPAVNFTTYAMTNVVSSSTSAETGNADLEKAITIVKSRITIPSGFDNFEYSSNSSDQGSSYDLCWYSGNTRYSGDYLYVTVCGNSITNYTLSNENVQGKPRFAKLSKTELQAKAKEYIAMLNPGMEKEIDFEGDVSISLSENSAYIYFNRVKDGVIFDKNSGSITIDKDTGKLYSFYVDWWEDAEFTSASSAISQDKIKESFKTNVNLEPVYIITTKTDGTKTAKAYYKISENKEFDAVTGKISTISEDRAKAYGTENYDFYASDAMVEEAECEEELAVTGTNAVTFTEAEQKALVDSGKLISQSEAKELVKNDKYMGITSTYTLSSGYLNTYSDDISDYTWGLYYYDNSNNEYNYLDVYINAYDSSVISFSKTQNNDKTKAVNATKGQKIAGEVLDYYLGDLASEYKPADSNSEKGEKGKSKVYSFYRYHNDILVDGDYAYIEIDNNYNVVGFNYSYTKDVKFESSKIISQETAYDKLFDAVDMTLYYDGFMDLKGNVKTYLLYSMPNAYINARTGKLCKEYGNVGSGQQSDNSCPYTDIANSKYKKYITELYNYGIKLTTTDNSFRPDEYITQREFTDVMKNISAYTSGLYNSDVPNSSSTALTKLTLAEIYCYSINAQDVAKMTDIYKQPFSDVKTSSENIGYFAIAKAGGILSAGSNNKIYPNKKITRAEAMKIIYNYIKANS